MFIIVAESEYNPGVSNITYCESSDDVIEFKLKKVCDIDNIKQANEYLKIPLTVNEILRNQNVVRILNGDVSRWYDSNQYDVYIVWHKKDDNSFDQIENLNTLINIKI
jgi:hypothetical protein